MPDVDAYRAVARLLLVERQTAGLDALAVRTASAFAREGIPSLLLRGPVMARWLYDDPAERPYSDVDLLVPRDRLVDASRVLLSMGMRQRLEDAAASERAPHA